MTDAFDSKQADFSGMTTAEKLFVGFVVHKKDGQAVIEIRS